MTIYLLISIAVANAQYLTCTDSCNNNKLTTPVLRRICKCYKHHIINKRDLGYDTNQEYAISYSQSNFPFNDEHSKNINTEIKTQQDTDISSKQFQENDYYSPNINIDKSNNNNKNYLRAIPITDYFPEDELNQSTKTIKYEIDVAPENDSYGGISVVDILKDLSECIELHRQKSFRACPNKKKNEETERLHSFEKLTDPELEIKIEEKCKRINAIIKNSLSEIKRKYIKSNSKLFDDRSENTSYIFDNTTYNNNGTTAIMSLVSTSHQNQLDYYDGSTEYYDQLTIKYNVDVDKTPIEIIQNNKNADNSEQSEYNLSTTAKTLQEEIINSDMTHPEDLNSFNFSFTSTFDTTTPSDLSIYDSIGLSHTKEKKYINKLPINRNNTALQDLNTTPLNEVSTSTDSINNDYIPDVNYLTKINTELEDSDADQSKNDRHILTTHNIYNESEVPVIRIISREFPNGTVLSEINGTETLMNNDFPFEHNYTNVYVKKINIDDHDVSETLYRFSIPKYTSSLDEGQESERDNMSLKSNSLVGRLYFVHDAQKIPVQFIQEADGKLNIGLDILSLCDKKNEEYTSMILKAICNCIPPPKYS